MAAEPSEVKSPEACRGHLACGAKLIVKSVPAATPQVKGRDVPKSPGRETQTPVVGNLARVDKGGDLRGCARGPGRNASTRTWRVSCMLTKPWGMNGPGAGLY